MSSDSRTPVEDLSRDELEDEAQRLRDVEDRLGALEQLIGTLGDVDPDQAGFKDVTIAGNPIGRMFDNHSDRLQALEEDTAKGGQIDESVRHALLPIHRMGVDLQRGDDTNGASSRRAARLFQRFLDLYLSDESKYEVDKSSGKLKMTASTAKRVLREEDDIPESGQSTIVKRTMKQMQSLAKEDDCGCSTLSSCDHGLMVWAKRKSQHTISADTDAFEAYLERVEDAINGTVTQPSDDSTGASRDEDGNTADETAEDDVFDQLHEAETITDDASDTVDTQIETEPETMPAQTDGGRQR